jgi:hypothetical protein
MKLSQTPHLVIACLSGLLLLAVVMFIAMLAGKEPHPPAARGPYLGAVAALAVASIWLLLVRERTGIWAGWLTVVAFIPSVGPHKFWTEPAAQALAPLIGVGTLLIIVAISGLVRIRQTPLEKSEAPGASPVRT